jgi:hypothetical protein
MTDSNKNLPDDFAALLESQHVSHATRKALERKLHTPERSGYFNEEQLQTLVSVAARLLPQDSNKPTVDLPLKLDAQLAGGVGKGWRYEVLPPDEVLFKQGMEMIEKAAQSTHQSSFTALNEEAQDVLLTHLQEGKIKNIDWPAEVQKRFFEELLAALTSIFYSHPIGRAEMGDRSFADLPDWQALGLNEVEPPSNRRPL